MSTENRDFPPQVPSRRRYGRGWWLVLWIVLGILVAGLIADWVVGQFYLTNRVPYGVYFAGSSVGGKDKAALESLIQKKYDDTSITVRYLDNSHTFNYQQLGVDANVQKTMDSLMEAKGANPFAKTNIFHHVNCGLSAVINSTETQFEATKALVPENLVVQEPSVRYDKAQRSFIVVNGHPGKSVDTPKIVNALEDSFSLPSSVVNISTSLQDAEPFISTSEAQNIALKAQDYLAKKYIIRGTYGGSYALIPSAIAQLLKFPVNITDQKMTVEVDNNAIQSYVNTTVAKAFTQQAIPKEELIVPSTGRVIAVIKHGLNGLKVENTQETITGLENALAKNESSTIPISTSIQRRPVKKVSVPTNFSVPNGSPWMEVDLSTQQAFAYRGTTLVKTFNVSTGRYGHLTPNGTYYVDIKYPVQTMRGPGYVAPGVRWVSYFNGGIAFHGAPWNLWGIAEGLPRSHGCINMDVNAAQWVYKFAPLGTKVVVIGTTPMGAVR